MPGLPSTTSEIESPTGCHETVDERGLHRDSGGRIDSTRGDEAGFHRLVEALLPVKRAPVLAFGRGEGARHAGPHVGYGLLLILGVFLRAEPRADRLSGMASATGESGSFMVPNYILRVLRG